MSNTIQKDENHPVLCDHHLLIEASAGTGKSFFLVLSYIKLLLGMSRGHPALEVDHILVITFTVAATQELKVRIREAIEALLRLLEAHETRSVPEAREAVWIPFLASISDPQGARDRLIQAKKGLELAPIYTLHGFCGRILRRWAFETGYPPPPVQLSDSKEAIWRAVQLFWKSYLEHPDPIWSQAMLAAFPEMEQLYQRLVSLVDLDDLQVDEALDGRRFPRAFRQAQARLERLTQAFTARPKSDWADGLAKLPRKKGRGGIRSWHVWVRQLGEILQERMVIPNQKLHDLLTKFLNTECFPNEKTPQWLIQWVQEVHAQATVPLFDPRPTFIRRGWRHLQTTFPKQLWKTGMAGFRDLLMQVDRALKGAAGRELAKALAEAYPVALVDEFQDTDPRQYRILKDIYGLHTQALQLLLIGDPKQSIYSFRGADLSTYFRAAQKVRKRHELTVNWRSNPQLLEAFNLFWRLVPHPFLYEALRFTPVQAAEGLEKPSLIHKGGALAPVALHILHNPRRSFRLSEYRAKMAQHCAAHVSHWLRESKRGQLVFLTASGSKPVEPSDLVLLVRNWMEAKALQVALKAEGLPSVYSSQNTLLLKTESAKILCRILKAIHLIEEPEWMRSILMEPWFGFSESRLQIEFQEDGGARYQIKFMHAREVWDKEGAISAIRYLLGEFQVPARLIQGAKEDVDPLEALHQLLEWLGQWEVSGAWESRAQWLAALELQMENEALGASQNSKLFRPRKRRNCLQIISIYKAKGLEFPIVWLPFVSHFTRKIGELYSHPQTLSWHWTESTSHRQSALKRREQLAEELRLLYVGMTRAVVHCALGGAPIVSGPRKTEYETEAHFSAFGYLIQKGGSGTREDFYSALAALDPSSKLFDLHWISDSILSPLPSREAEGVTPTEGHTDTDNLAGAPTCVLAQATRTDLTHPTPWAIKSYSGLCRRLQETPLSTPFATTRLGVVPGPDEQGEEQRENLLDGDNSLCETSGGIQPLEANRGQIEWGESEGRLTSADGETRSPASVPSTTCRRGEGPVNLEGLQAFPRGPKIGNCLHLILEKWDFQQPLDPQWVSLQLKDFGIDPHWSGMVTEWFMRVARTPLGPEGFCLNALAPEAQSKEMSFLVEVPTLVTAEGLEARLRLGRQSAAPDPASTLCFKPFSGALRGYIDLVCLWQGKYYLVDYKSNWLGPAGADYEIQSLSDCMGHHRYDVQYALYMVALHRHLKSRLKEYDYDRNIGGVLYLFLRGMSNTTDQASSRGVFFYRHSLTELAHLETYLGA